MTTWLITGCSTGIGRALAEAVIARGDPVVATARDVARLDGLGEEHPERVARVALDVTERGSIAVAVDTALERFSHVDVLVNNAGYGYRAAVEEGEDDALRAMFETNFFGAVNVINAVLPFMRKRRSGTIVNISSIGARRAAPGSAYYVASKAALEALTASLSKEVAPLGIRAFSVEPGAFRTDFSGRSLTGSGVVIADYDETVGPRRKGTDQTDGTQRGDPARAAAAIITAATHANPPQMLVLGPDAYEVFTNSLDALRADLDEWRELTLGTDFSED